MWEYNKIDNLIEDTVVRNWYRWGYLENMHNNTYVTDYDIVWCYCYWCFIIIIIIIWWVHWLKCSYIPIHKVNERWQQNSNNSQQPDGKKYIFIFEEQRKRI